MQPRATTHGTRFIVSNEPWANKRLNNCGRETGKLGSEENQQPVAALLWGRNGFDRVRKRNSASG